MLHQANIKELCQWAWRASRGVKTRILAIAIIGLLRVAASLGFVWISKMLIDTATSGASTSAHIWHVAAMLVIVMIIEMLLTQTSNYLISLTSAKMTNNLRHRIYTTILGGSLYDDRKHSGDILNRITLDVNTVVSTIVNTLPSMIIMSVQLAAAFWLLTKMNTTLAVCALVIMPICILASKAYIKKVRTINAAIRDRESSIHSNLQEGLQHRIVVQTLECSPLMLDRLAGLQDSLFGHILRKARISFFSRSMVRLGFISCYLIAFIWSVFSLHAGIITYGMMTAFLQLVGRIQMPISSLSSNIPSIISTATAIDRLSDLDDLRQGKQAEKQAHKKLAGPLGVRVQNVDFAYGQGQPQILQNFSYDFAPGSKTVIMGETGVGKSTLTKLILSLLKPQAGSVEIYDERGEAVPSSDDTRNYMVYVPQGNSLLEGTIRENLLMGDPEATDEQMAEALNIAVANFAYDLPDGLDTKCGELGSSLSEGQCQRIAIARALLRKGNLLIFDEFNSSLDTETASTLMRRLIASRPDATIIFISHRIEAAADAGAAILRIN